VQVLPQDDLVEPRADEDEGLGEHLARELAVERLGAVQA
jgi:hypothetical protein